MFPNTVKGNVLSSDDLINPRTDDESISHQLERIQRERIKAQTAQERIRQFLYSFKLAAKQVRSITSRPGIEPTPQELVGLSHQQAEALKNERIKQAMEVINNQIRDTNGLLAKFVKRCRSIEKQGAFSYGIEWDDPAFNVRLREYVANMVCDMWAERKEANYEARFMDFVDYTMRTLERHDPPVNAVMENLEADRMLVLHKAFMDLDEALMQLHPTTDGSWYTEEAYRLLFGQLKEASSEQRAQHVMDEVIIPLTERSCDNVSKTLGADTPLSVRDSAIIYKAMLSHVSRDAAMVIRFEGRMLLHWLEGLTTETCKGYMNDNGAFTPWLLSRCALRLKEFYPDPDEFMRPTGV